MNEPITRSVDIDSFRAEETSEGITLEGMAAVFNRETVIDSVWEGKFREQIAPGAFARTLAEDRPPVLQYDHGSHPFVGSIPLGRIDELVETDEGLFVRATLAENIVVAPITDAIKLGGLRGMSFRFRVEDSTVEPGRGSELDLRTLNDVSLFELGPVVFPAYQETSVSVRSEIKDLMSDPAVVRAFIDVLYEQRGDAAQAGASTTPDSDNVIALAQARAKRTALRLRGL